MPSFFHEVTKPYALSLPPISDEGSSENRDYFPASRLFEYKWPLHDEQAEQYFLQEQVAEFLGIRGIQHKYPGESGFTCECTCECAPSPVSVLYFILFVYSFSLICTRTYVYT